MTNTSRKDAITAPDLADSVQEISNVYCASVERIFALNMGAVRDAISDMSVVNKALCEKNAANALQSLPQVLGQPMLEKTIAYSRGASEIISQTGEEISKIVSAQLGNTQTALNLPASWTSMFDSMVKAFQQFGSNAAENAAATSDSTSRAALATKLHAGKVA